MSSRFVTGVFIVLPVVGTAVFFIPFPYRWANVAVYLLIAVTAAVFQAWAGKKARVQQDKTITELKKELEKFNFELQVASSQVSSVSEQLYITLDENNAFAQQVYAETTEMADLNGQVNESMHNTLDSVRGVISLLEDARNTSLELEKTSSSSSTVVKNSLEEILEIVDTIHEIQATSNGTMEYMDKLTHTSKEIIGILETVNSISKQTHLLSLNASIESARAGEAGKGFAVVADQIRKLALDSGEAVKDVNQLISAIQDEVLSVHRVVKENSVKVEKGVKGSRNIEGNLEKIHNSFQGVLDMVKKIIGLSEEEVVLANHVVEKIGDVEKFVGVTSKSVEEVKNSVHKQKQSIEGIAEMGSRLSEASKNLTDLLDNSGFKNFSMESTENVEKIGQTFRIMKEIASSPDIQRMDRTVHREAMAGLPDKYDYIEAAWSNDAKGRFICSIPEAGIANANVRDWFKRSIKGEDFVSPVYISAITKNPCITLSAPIKTKNGDIIGVIGVDLKL